MKIEPVTVDTETLKESVDIDPKDVLGGKLLAVLQALESTAGRFEREFRRHAYGPRITHIEPVAEPKAPDWKLDFRVEVCHKSLYRETKLRFELVDCERRRKLDSACKDPSLRLTPRQRRIRNVNAYECERGRRDLSLIYVFIRRFEDVGRIIRRIYKALHLVVSDIARQADAVRSRVQFASDRKWRWRRRRIYHRPQYIPALAA